ncbi:hypothetical protein [Paeniglutamicibacter sp.]|uniref:hypothetical protein n=1 Tax=Paeniglutamicibacter sp. TaxID=1934391 RepID=UPI003989ECEE
MNAHFGCVTPGGTIRKILAAIVVAIFAFTGLIVGAVPAAAAEEISPPANLRIGPDFSEYCVGPTVSEADKKSIGCTSIFMYSTRTYPDSMGMRDRPVKNTFLIKNLATGKNVPLRDWGTITGNYTTESYIYPSEPKLKPGRYEVEMNLDFPAGSVCQSYNWCTAVPRYVEKRVFQFTWTGKTQIVKQTFKATATKSASKTGKHTASKSASYTGSATHKATATASYRYKGKTYKATASHSVKATHKTTMVRKATVSNAKRTASATKSATSMISQAAANKAAAAAATSAAGKSAQSAATKAARTAAEIQASNKAKQAITATVKSQARAKAKSKLTKQVKASALKVAQAKALQAAKKKA